jgi:hypothetical protein
MYICAQGIHRLYTYILNMNTYVTTCVSTDVSTNIDMYINTCVNTGIYTSIYADTSIGIYIDTDTYNSISPNTDMGTYKIHIYKYNSIHMLVRIICRDSNRHDI